MTTALSGVPRVNGEYQGYVNGLTNGHASKISKQHMNGNSQPILDGRSIHQNDDFTNEMVKGNFPFATGFSRNMADLFCVNRETYAEPARQAGARGLHRSW